MKSIPFEDCPRQLPARQRDSRGSGLKHVALALWLGALPGGAAIAQEFPAKPVLLIVPFPAGGSTDILARLLAEAMRPALGQPVLVQNVPGAGLDDRRRPRRAVARRTATRSSIGNWTSHVGAGAVYPVPWHPAERISSRSRCSTTSTLIIVGRTGLAGEATARN